MRRFFTYSFFVLLSGSCISATLPFRKEQRVPSFAVNSEVSRHFTSGNRTLPGIQFPSTIPTSADSAATAYKVLLFNYSAYDSVYAVQMHHFLERELPGATLTDFFDGSAEYFGRLLEAQQAVVITYPFVGDADQLGAYGKKLETFIRNGGLVVVSGTHGYDVLHQLGMLEVDNTYYYEGGSIHVKKENHPLLNGVPNDFSVSNFIYAFDLADAGFITLAEAEGFPVVGYKDMGEGKLVYLGLEYYDDEALPSRLLKNAFKWGLPEPVINPNTTPVAAVSNPAPARPAAKSRSEEILYTGNSQKFDLKVYPNPYMEKAALEINLEKSSVVTVEMTNETGASVALLLPQRNLSAGFYRVEVPDVNPGIYFIKCKIGGHIEVRKVVKIAQQ